MRKQTCKAKLIFLAAAMTAFISTVSLAADYEGALDTVNDTSVSGWAWDKSAPETTVPVSIQLTNQSTGQLVDTLVMEASGFRSNLRDAGYGTGKYAFTCPVDWSRYPDGRYQITAYMDSTPLTNVLTYQKGDIPAGVNTGSLRSLGTFRTTAYCSCRKCCGKWGGTRTASGTRPTVGRTVAVDPKIIPFGTKLMINGNVYTAEDTGSGVNGNHIDIYFSSHSQALKYGLRRTEVYLIQ